MSLERAHAIGLEAPDGTRAEIVPDLGGVVSSLQFATPSGLREVLFRHDHFWDPASEATRGGIPVLFPACGRVRWDGKPCYRLDARSFEMPIHGFAMRRPWMVTENAKDALTMTLQSDADTMRAFPFDCSLRAAARVVPGMLTLQVAIQNTGAQPLPFGAGWHPYLLAPSVEEKDRMAVDLPATAAGRYDESYTAIPRWSEPLARPLHPTHPLFREVLHRVAPGPARVRWPDGFSLSLVAEAGGAAMPYWQLHTEPDKPFVCVEPWTSPPNALNSGRDLLWLAPGCAWSMSLSIKSECSR